MRELFRRTVRTAVAMELVDLAVQAVDGTKVTANAALIKTYDARRLGQLLERVESAIEDLEARNEAGEDTAVARLPEKLADQKALRERVREAMKELPGKERPNRYRRPARINLTDKDARLMRTRQGTVPSYNAQAMVEQSEEITGVRVPMTLADAGYFAGRHVAEMHLRGQQVVMPDMARRTDDPYHKDQFIYHEETDSYTCPHGHVLPFTGVSNNKARKARTYRMASGSVCRECPAFGVCTKNASVGRSLQIGQYDTSLRRHRDWMASSEAQKAYLRRLPLVEPLFAIIKHQLGAQRFTLRGLANVKAEWNMLATAINLRTLWKVWRTGADMGWHLT